MELPRWRNPLRFFLETENEVQSLAFILDYRRRAHEQSLSVWMHSDSGK
jgi:hypothetical protein